ncbi:MAG TPA: amino acid adenylation domain-containing protein [Pyrinomonadaceae bacterium]|nr:amino acid adenylation domain-containing protein [Pyrinomonadaceae bacterium]
MNFNNVIDTSDLSQAESFWRRRLKGYDAPVQLPAEVFPQSITRAGEHERELELSATATKALQTPLGRQQLTLDTLLQGAWALLLSRHSGSNDVVFGVAISTNPLPVRVTISPETPLLSWLKDLQHAQSEAQPYEDSPLNQVQEWSDLPAGVPLFESVLVFENRPAEELTVERINYPLTVTITLGAKLALRIRYDEKRFSGANIDRILIHLRNLLESFAEQPDQPLASVNMLSAAEREQQLIEWNPIRASFPGHLDYARLFEQQVARTPENIAIVDDHEHLTYQELNRRANQLAHLLRQCGVGPESLVGICLERSAGMVVALLAVFKAGGAYVPLDPQYPRERLSFMLEDSGLSIIVTQQHLVRSIPPNDAFVICIDSDREAITSRSTTNPEVNVAPENLAYVIYTSGSTGRPKGVQICHRALINFLHSMRTQPGIDENDVLLSVTTLSFDIAGLEIYLPLMVGACLVMASHAAARDARLLATLMDDRQATLMQATSTTWRMLLDSGWQGREQLKMLCGGEALSGELAERLLKRGRELWNLYGPTETTIWSSIYKVDQTGATVSIGVPIANTNIYILDRALQLIPSGSIGEIYIGGEGLARGYLNRVDTTAETFIPDALSGESGAQLYRTGDVGRYLSNGNIEYLGRADHQVKVRGFRIELGEIEAVLRRHQAIKDVVVVVREDVRDDKRIVAYVVLKQASKIREDGALTAELRKLLTQKLPDYMIPSAFVELAALPLTPNGKVQRNALPAPHTEYEVSRTQTA